MTVRPRGVGTPGANITSADCSVTTPHGPVEVSWTGPYVHGAPHGNLTCNMVPESATLSLACPDGVIDKVDFASYGTPEGECPSLRHHSACDVDVSDIVTAECVGQTSCTLQCHGDSCNGQAVKDPCYGTKKNLAVSVGCSHIPTPPAASTPVTLSVVLPPGSAAAVRVPLVAAVGHTTNNVVITESGAVVWRMGAFVANSALENGFVDSVGSDLGITFLATKAGSYVFSVDLP